MTPSTLDRSRYGHIIRMHRLFDHIAVDCPVCGARSKGVVLCPACLKEWHESEFHRSTARCLRCALTPIDPRAPCWDCIREPPAYWATVAALPYQPPYDGLVSQLKNRHRLWVARSLGQLVSVAAQRHPQVAGALIDWVLPIPASTAALHQRGFNPAGEIAREVSRCMGVALSRCMLARTRIGAKQSRLGRTARLRAAVGLFEASDDVEGKCIAVVDDVMTTGGTVNAAATALLQKGARKVIVLVASRAFQV